MKRILFVLIAGLAGLSLAQTPVAPSVAEQLDIVRRGKDHPYQIQDLRVKNTAVIGGKVTLAGEISGEHLNSTDDLVVGDDATVSGKVSVAEGVSAATLNVSGTATAATLKVNGALTATNGQASLKNFNAWSDGIVGGGLTVSGAVSAVGRTDVGNLYTTGRTYAAEVWLTGVSLGTNYVGCLRLSGTSLVFVAVTTNNVALSPQLTNNVVTGAFPSWE